MENKKAFICKKEFKIPILDDNDLMSEEEEYLHIKKGSVWFLCGKGYISEVRLINEKNGWIEVIEDRLTNNFSEIKEEK